MKQRRASACRVRRGVTLIEVLATIVLMGIVLPVAMRGVSLALSAASTARHRTEATSLAESKMGELLATGEWQYGGTAGDFGQEWPGYEWSAETGQWDSNVTDVTQLLVRVTWTARGERQKVDLYTLVYQNAAATGSTSGTGTASTP